MMGLQTVGAFLLSAAAYLACARRSDYELSEMRREDGFAALLSLIGVLSGAGGIPLSAVYARFCDEALERCGFLSRLREKGLFAALSETGETALQNKAALDILLRFAKEIEVCPNTESAAKCCEKYRALYGAEIERTREKKKTHAALLRKMGFFAACFVLLFGL